MKESKADNAYYSYKLRLQHCNASLREFPTRYITFWPRKESDCWTQSCVKKAESVEKVSGKTFKGRDVGRVQEGHSYRAIQRKTR